MGMLIPICKKRKPCMDYEKCINTHFSQSHKYPLLLFNFEQKIQQKKSQYIVETRNSIKIEQENHLASIKKTSMPIDQ